jgi:hypothetical protein
VKLPLHISPLMSAPTMPEVSAAEGLTEFLNNYALDLILERGQKPIYRGKRFRLPKVEKLWQFVLDLQEFEQVCKVNGYPKSDPSGVLPKLGSKATAIYERINASIVKLRPIAQLALPSENGWKISFVARMNYPTKSSWYDYVAWIVVLTEAVEGNIQKIRQCSECFNWFVRKREEIHKFCSRACRDKAYRRHPDVKRLAAARQRRHREHLKLRDKANLRTLAQRRK